MTRKGNLLSEPGPGQIISYSDNNCKRSRQATPQVDYRTLHRLDHGEPPVWARDQRAADVARKRLSGFVGQLGPCSSAHRCHPHAAWAR